ncbi:hypothetical protein [Aquibaculum arenosum]|uniref:Holin n=1 Tax=Aquibaculum arenosum TaxID=3032591 RepID=A0ABT5YQT7_9PROT|nr:hypothetical protein [Fodinicurvata sp. CAU 1616]MDF2097324.1 hypothetical protein [Fodinicurvata sp. CAU 1616]
MYREKLDLMLGSAATAFGTSGAALQWWGQLGSLLLVGLNVILACAGLYLIWLRIRRARLELERVSRDR